jgi:membrane carboxypeptidase/penicillin-binding protein
MNININGIPHRISFHIQQKWIEEKRYTQQYQMMSTVLSKHQKNALPPIEGGIQRSND